jgi:L-threonylcarbamoyladenylate synthase
MAAFFLFRDFSIDSQIAKLIFAFLSFHSVGKTMQILDATEKNIVFASTIVKKGGLVVYPTETVYGLGCDPFNIESVKRVFQVKGDRKKPLPILASDIKHIESIAYLSENAKHVATRFWPGPLTMVLNKKPSLDNVVTCGQDTVGVRIPRHDVALRLIQLSGGLLVGTSANKSGEKPPQTAEDAAKQIGEEVDTILDGGSTSFGVSSTLVDFTSTRLLREGPISLEEIFTSLQS